MTQYNTDRFFVLRKIVAGDPPAADALAIPPETARKLRACRATARESREAFHEAGLHVWDALAELEQAGSLFALPPRYNSGFIRTEFCHAMCMLHCLSEGKKAPGDHRIYHGLRGTGKTMFLHVVGAVAACLLETALPIYWTYEKSSPSSPSPVQLIRAAAVLEQGTGSLDEYLANITEADWQLNHMAEGLPVLLLLDEFTTLYCRGAEDTAVEAFRVNGRKIIGDLVSLGKARNTVIMLAASHNNVGRYVHPSQDPEHAEFGTYPDLNNGVYMSRPILPLREPGSIQEYFVQRYTINLTDGEAREVFRRTGGVGRWMANWNDNRDFLPNSCVGTILSNPLLLRLSVHIVSTASHSSGVSYHEAVLLLDHDMHLLEQCCDEMIFVQYRHKVNFVCPAIEEELRESLQQQHDLHSAAVLYLTHQGFLGGTPGHSSKSLFRKHLHKHFQCQPHDERDDISIIDGKTTFQLLADGKQFDSERYCGKLLHLAKEEGIDAFWLELGNENTLYVSALQLKTGRASTKMTAGVLTTQRRNRGLGKTVDDSTIARVLVRAERSFTKLANALTAQLQSLETPMQISFDQFFLLTDRAAVTFQQFKIQNTPKPKDGEHKQEHDNNLDDANEFPIDVHLHHPAINQSFTVEVLDFSSGWMRVLPHNLLEIAYPELCR